MNDHIQGPASLCNSCPGPDSSFEVGWLDARDGERLYYRCWQGRPGHALVVYFHGIEGHGGWFERTAARLNEQGLTVWACDRRGAGANFSNRGELRNLRVLIDDAGRLIAQARERHGDGALILMGNCWGAKVAIATASHYAAQLPGLSGLVLTSPALGVRVDVDAATKLAIAWSYLSRSARRFPIPLTAEMFTGNPVYLEYILSDPLRLTEATASFFIESLKLTWVARRAARHLRVPVLLMQAGDDRIVNMNAVERWFARLKSADKTLRIFPQAAHSLDFDERFEEYVEVLTGWIRQHAGEV